MNKKLRIGVIGVGHLGTHHAKILSQTTSIELVGIFDVDSDRRHLARGLFQGRFNREAAVADAIKERGEPRDSIGS